MSRVFMLWALSALTFLLRMSFPTPLDKIKTHTRLVGRVLYDGTDFAGWQSQGEATEKRRVRTVQSTLNKVVRRRFNMNELHVTGSSRTDAGFMQGDRLFISTSHTTYAGLRTRRLRNSSIDRVLHSH